MTVSREVVANQVFIACPWHTVKSKYEACIAKLNNKYPLSFIIIGRDEKQEAEDLLAEIKVKLLSSSYAVFDATGGNANVSLEFGLAEANSVPRALYLCVHKSAKKSTKDSPIIADLAGKKQNRYTQLKDLRQRLDSLCKNHTYTTRFEKFLRSNFGSVSKGKKRSARSLALKIVHSLDGKETLRRADVVDGLLAENYSRAEIDNMIRRLHQSDLVQSGQGPYATLLIP